MDGFYARILKKAIEWDNGYIIPSSKPGLGIEINEDLLKDYPYNDRELHLKVYETI